RLVASGEVTQEEAYIECYPTARKWKPASVRCKASVLANNVNIRATIAEIRAAANRVSRMKLERAQSILSARIEALAAEANLATTGDLCRAVDSLARISGWNQPDAVAVAAVQIVTPEERARRIREALGIPEEAEG
ncbi:MAG: hypothetical protein IIZ06_00840, partial [Kiritimatiellae bacterium]|nr:hypothetical protein [Kiritimatiellia bacterium]